MFAFANKHPYHEVVMSTEIKSNNPLAIAIHDQRHYVVDGSKSATFVGSLRSGVGIPYDITTKSGKPLADDMLEVAGRAIEKNGVKLHKVVTRSGLSKEDVVAELKKTQAPRSLYFNIMEWKTDTYMKADLYCREGFGGSFWNPKKAAKKGSLKAVKLKMEALVNDPNILKAIE